MADEQSILRDLGGVTNFLGREFRSVANAGIGMAGELLNANQSLSAYSSAIAENTGLLGDFGKVVNGLVKFAEESLSEYQALSGIGATFGKEMSNIKITAAELGMSVKDMTDLFMRNSTALRTFGGTTDVAINNFTRLSKSLLDSSAGTELRRLGYTAADINETLLVYNELAQQDGLNRTRSTAEQASSARDFAVELDGLAKLTGKQRKELADEMRERRRQGDVQAFLMGQSAETQEQFMLATQKIRDTMGPQFEELFQDLMIRGAPITEDTRNAFIALGGSADEFEASVASFRRGMSSNNFDEFNASLTGAQGAFLDNLKTDEARSMAMMSGMSGVSDAMAQAYQSSYDFANAVDASAEGQESAQETIQKLQQQISEEQLQQMQTTGGLLDKTIQMQESLRQFTIAATTEVLPRLEAMAVRGIDYFLERMPSAEQLAAQLAGGVDQLFDRIDNNQNQNPFNFDFGGTPTAGDGEIVDAVSAGADAVGVGVDETAAETTETVTSELQSAEDALATAQAESDAARSEAEAELAAAQERLDSLTAAGFERTDGRIVDAQERVAAAESALQSTINDGNARVMQAVQAAATAFTNSKVQQFQQSQATGRRFSGGFAEGGKIGHNEFGLVGEAGIELINGPANITSAKETRSIFEQLQSQVENVGSGNVDTAKSMFDKLDVQFDSMGNKTTEQMGVLKNLLQGIKGMDNSLQTQAQTATNSISTTNREYGNLEPKFDAMISLLSQLVSVEVGAERTAQRTFKATRGLQGNMLRGLGV